MTSFDWNTAASILEDFGGENVTLHITKSGLPFFDALRLYGAIDLYIGLREDVSIQDAGNEWSVNGRKRTNRLVGKDEAVFRKIWTKKKPLCEKYCASLREIITNGIWISEQYYLEAKGDWDAILQAGIRGIAARSYDTLQTGQTSKKECKACIPLSQGLLAFAGLKRVEGIGNLIFLPIFEGKIDISKVVSPLRAWMGAPNIPCTQALLLLALKTSLFAEGYQERFTAVVFNTDFHGQRSDNYSGLISIASTAIGKIRLSSFANHLYRVFHTLVNKAWVRQGKSYKTKDLAVPALEMAYWLLQPIGKNLSPMVASQEQLCKNGLLHMFTSAEYVKEVFEMSYGDWKGDHEAVRLFAKAIASSIYNARMKKEGEQKDKRKAWYDEVTMLRSASSPRAFIERAMILMEQGHREHGLVGTIHRDENFDPRILFSSIGTDRSSFETFRDLFRMYLIQESTYKVKEEDIAEENNDESVEDLVEFESGKEDEK